MTYTINDSFGAKVIAGDTGFLFNDEMDDFTAKPGSPKLLAWCRERPMRSRRANAPELDAPTIVLKDGRPVLVLGTPGGSRIITTVLEVLVNVIDYGMDCRRRSTHRASIISGCPTRFARNRSRCGGHGAGADAHGLSRRSAGTLGRRQCGGGDRHRASSPAQARALGFTRPQLMYGRQRFAGSVGIRGRAVTPSRVSLAQ